MNGPTTSSFRRNPTPPESAMSWVPRGVADYFRLSERHCSIYADSTPQHQLNHVLCSRAELASVRLKPDILRTIRAAYPVWEQRIEFAG